MLADGMNGLTKDIKFEGRFTFQVTCVEMHLTCASTIAVEHVFGDLFGRERILASFGNRFAHMAYGCHGNDDFSHSLCVLNRDVRWFPPFKTQEATYYWTVISPEMFWSISFSISDWL